MSNTMTTVPLPPPSAPTTLSRTRIHQPRQKWVLRALWLVVLVFNVAVFINGLNSLDAQTSQRLNGLAVEPQADGTWQVKYLASGEARTLARIGDVLLAVNGQPFNPNQVNNRMNTSTFTLQTPGQVPREVVLRRQFAETIVDGGVAFGLSDAAAQGILRLTEIITFGACVAVALLIFVLRSDDWLALFVTWALMIAGLAFTFSFFAVDLPRFPMNNRSHLYSSLALPIAMISMLYFPSGVIRPRWAWVPPVVYGIALVILAAFPLPSPFLTGLPNAFAVSFVFAILFRNYRRHFTAIERQQTKWIVFGLLGFTLGTLIQLTVQIFGIGQPYEALILYSFVARLVEVPIGLMLPLGFAFSILRYRLWDIDIVLNRSLVGILVTGIVILIYGTAFLIIRPIMEALFGASDALVPIVIAAAISGVTFTPVRQQVRRLIDRNVYGLRYDLNQIRRAQSPAAVEGADTLILPMAPRPENQGIYSGRTFDRWQLQGVIGRGGMGEVYKATDDRQRYAAIKVLAADLILRPEYRARFEREAETLQALDHPQIVKLLGYGQTPDAHYLAMEFVEGEELSRFIRRNGASDLLTVTTILTDIAAALDYAHQRGFVHRDVKPSNIMLRRDRLGMQEAVLMDFGIAKIQDAQTRYTGSGAIGTIDYMAPEQIIAAREVDHRADIYALGIVAYELLTGQRPFKGGVGQVLFAHIQQPPPDPRTVLPSLSKPVAAAVLRALEKNAVARYSSAVEFVRALTAAVS